MKIRKVQDYLWEIPKEGKMRVPARIYATENMMSDIRGDNAAQQAMNVAHLPGILKYSLAMPDIHWGYGFPIGGVAAFDLDDGVISPGGVGYDINCGVRLMTTKLERAQITPKLPGLVKSLFKHIPTGVGARGELKVDNQTQKRILQRGAGWAVENDFESESDLEFIEENGCVTEADPSSVSERAFERGKNQLGTLGSGNHFLEVGYVSEIYDLEAAKTLGLEIDQVTVIIHCGSRGFGHQVCDDYLKIMIRVAEKYGIELPDRQLCCAPIKSSEGQKYLGAMRCAVNFAFADRQVIASWTRKAFREALELSGNEIGLRTVYEVAHNIAKIEKHQIDSRRQNVCVHRKGATRAFAPGSDEIPQVYKKVGQPVLIPGDMGRYSYVLVGAEAAMTDTFGSTCHGAGRSMSRTKAKKVARGRSVARELEDRGIFVKASSRRTIDEELPEAYKDVSQVVDACQLAGISKKVAQLRPLGCIKG